MKPRELIDLLLKCPQEAEIGVVCLDIHDTLMPIEQVGYTSDGRFVVFNNYKKSEVVASGDSWFQEQQPERYIDTSQITWLTK